MAGLILRAGDRAQRIAAVHGVDALPEPDERPLAGVFGKRCERQRQQARESNNEEPFHRRSPFSTEDFF
jgi:hypothetical protein